jgi:hypothetical protein
MADDSWQRANQIVALRNSGSGERMKGEVVSATSSGFATRESAGLRCVDCAEDSTKQNPGCASATGVFELTV